MKLTDVLDALHTIRICAPLGLPTWAAEVSVEGRTYSPRHVVCVSAPGSGSHHHCLAASRPVESFSLATLDGRGNGGRMVCCAASAGALVDLSAAQVADLEVLGHLATALTLDRYLAVAAEDDPESAVSAEMVLSALDAAAAAAPGGVDDDRVRFVSGILAVNALAPAG